MLCCNCRHGSQLTRTHSIFCYFVVCLVIQSLWWRFPFLRLCHIFRCRCCHVHSNWKFPLRKELVGLNPSCLSNLTFRREDQAGLGCPGWRQSIPKMETTKKRYGMSWPNFSATTAEWAPPSSDWDREANPKRKMKASPCSWNCNKRSLQSARPYSYNISNKTSLLLVYFDWIQILLILYFHSGVLQRLFIDWICHYLIISDVVSLFSIMLITSMNRTHNWLSYLQCIVYGDITLIYRNYIWTFVDTVLEEVHYHIAYYFPEFCQKYWRTASGRGHYCSS